MSKINQRQDFSLEIWKVFDWEIIKYSWKKQEFWNENKIFSEMEQELNSIAVKSNWVWVLLGVDFNVQRQTPIVKFNFLIFFDGQISWQKKKKNQKIVDLHLLQNPWSV